MSNRYMFGRFPVKNSSEKNISFSRHLYKKCKLSALFVIMKWSYRHLLNVSHPYLSENFEILESPRDPPRFKFPVHSAYWHMVK